MKKQLLRSYARLIVRRGANVQPDQRVVITAAVDQHAFVTLVMEECYAAGARSVRVDWSCDAHTLLHYRYRSLEDLSMVTDERKARLQAEVEELPAQIHIVSDDPNGLDGIDREKMMKARQASWGIIKPYRDAMENRYQWVIAAVPSKAWARKVFPSLSPAKAVEALWEAILASCRVTEGGDALAAWAEHDAAFVSRCRWLNEHHFDTVTYQSSNGTDFRAGLISEGQWCGGGEETIGGVYFDPNIPTE